MALVPAGIGWELAPGGVHGHGTVDTARVPCGEAREHRRPRMRLGPFVWAERLGDLSGDAGLGRRARDRQVGRFAYQTAKGRIQFLSAPEFKRRTEQAWQQRLPIRRNSASFDVRLPQ